MLLKLEAQTRERERERESKRLRRFVINFFLILSLLLQNFLFLVNPVFANSSQATWWDNNYLYRQQITVTAGSDQVPADYSIKTSIDTSSLQTAGKVRSDRKDWRIVYYNSSTSTWTEIARYYAGTSATWFKTQAAINASASDSNYYAYYGYSSESTSPQTYTQNFGLNFNGSSQYVSVSDNSVLRVTTAFTIEAWVYVTPSNSTVVCKGATAADPDYLLTLGRTDHTGAVGLYNGTAWQDSDNSVVSAGAWTHIAVVYDNSNYYFYVNGGSAGSALGSGSIQTSTAGLQIGTQCNGSTNAFNGGMDDIRIWNVARTQTQIQNNKDSELVGNESGLVANWKLNDASGITATDSTSNNNSGTLTNGPSWIATRQSVISSPTINDATTQEIASYSVYYNGYGSSTYQIGQATSSDDGISFTKYASNPVLTKSVSGWDSVHVKDPWAIIIGSTYYLYYAGYSGSEWAIGLATSSDGLSFTKYGSNPILQKSASGWDSAGVTFPAVFYDNSESDSNKVYKMFYGGQNASGTHQIGLAFSPDGLTWTKYGSNPVIPVGSSGNWDDYKTLVSTNPVKIGSTYYLYYGGLDDNDATTGKWQIGLVTFTDFEGTYTKSGSNPVVQRRSSAVQTLTAQTNSASKTVTVTDTSVFQVNEPVFLRDTGSNDEINRISSIDSSTQLTLQNAAVRNYPANSTIRSWMTGSIVPRTVEYSGGTWRMWFTPFQPYTPSDLLRELTGYATSSDGISWTLDYANSPPVPYNDESGQWDAISSENPAVIIPSQQTVANASSPSNFSGSADSSTAITWSWTDNSSIESGFKVHDEGGTEKQSLSANTSSWQETSLSVNTQYIRHVHAYTSGNSDPSNEYRLYTLANTPGTPTVGSPSGTSLKVTVDINSNPSSTEFAVYETSTGKYVQSDGTLGASAVWRTYSNWGSASGQTVSGLTAGTTYTFEVKARNGDSVETAFSSTASANTDNTEPAISLTALSPDPNNDNTPTLSGTATEAIGTVSNVQSQIDSTSGSWSSCSASDGSFNSASEAFTCTPSNALSDGSHTMYVRATDSNGNTTSNANATTDSYTIDITAPASFDLDSPGDNSYTNSERPTFKWKATTDATAGLSKYVLEIDNPSIGSSQSSGDFTIDSIPTSRTTDYETNKYTIHYENFSDSDSTNNYISVYTKSHNDWGSSENDGKLREGKISWKVKAVDNAGNERSSSRTLFVDRTSPSVTFTQINSTPYTTNSFSTTDKTPTIFGKITDSLSGGDSSQTQDENGPKIASGPKQVDIKVEKKEGLTYKLVTLYTINMDNPYYTCDSSKTIDNSKQKCDKYLPFEYLPKESLDLGTYKIIISGKDKADNTSSESSFTLNITTLAQITTSEEIEVIEKEIKELSKEEQEKVKKELEITKSTEAPKPNILEKTGENISQFSKNVINITGNIVSAIFTGIGAGIKIVFNGIGSGLAFAGSTIGKGYNAIANNAPGVTKNVLLAIGNTVNKAVNGTKNQIANLAFAIGEKTQDFSESAGFVLVKLGYLFVNEPTKIADVQVAVLSPTSVKVSWKTNHPANGKVNYGLDETYPFDVQSEKRLSQHEFTLTDLKPDTQYYFEVMSHNKNYVYDANRKFKTPAE